jgi:hypothetical protein
MKVELLRVADVFNLTHQGLVCAQFFQLPTTGEFHTFTAVVTIQPPNRTAFDVDASFSVTHFKISDLAVPAEKCWQIVICLGKISKDSVPV